jgi:prepilin signal peptidase PulO-like enzyme (type II secretory pathway)
VIPVLVVAAAAVVAALGVRIGGRTATARGLWWLAVGGAAVGALVAVARSPAPVAAALAAGGLAAAAVVDAVEHRIPTAVAHGTTLLSLGLLAAHAVDADAWGPVVRAIGLTALLVVALAGVWLAGGAGFGDVRLAAATVTAMVTGAAALANLVVVAFLVAGVGALATRATRGTRAPGDHRLTVPFGPALALGWLAAVAFR